MPGPIGIARYLHRFRQTGSVLGACSARSRRSPRLEVTFAIGAGLVAVVAALSHAAQ